MQKVEKTTTNTQTHAHTCTQRHLYRCVRQRNVGDNNSNNGNVDYNNNYNYIGKCLTLLSLLLRKRDMEFGGTQVVEPKLSDESERRQREREE